LVPKNVTDVELSGLKKKKKTKTTEGLEKREESKEVSTGQERSRYRVEKTTDGHA